MYYQQSENKTFTLHTEIRAAFPNVSFPQEMTDEMIADFGVYPVTPTDKPAHNEATQKCVELTPTGSGSTWSQAWSVVTMTYEEQQAFAVTRLADITAAVQARLDNWSKEHFYDGIMSLCTYATSSVPKFATEGQRGVDNRDATWAKCYAIMADYTNGQRPLPTVSEVLSELPLLEWPAV